MFDDILNLVKEHLGNNPQVAAAIPPGQTGAVHQEIATHINNGIQNQSNSGGIGGNLLSEWENSLSSGNILASAITGGLVSSLASNGHYHAIIQYFSKVKFSTRNDIAKFLKIKTGGYLSNLLRDLELCNFIKQYTPYNLKENSMLARYCIHDNFLTFYFKFIKPIVRD